MALSDATFRTALATWLGTQFTHAAAHTAAPATSGNELTGAGSSRGSITWGSAAASVISGTATVTVPTAGGTLAALGMWSASTAGTFRDSIDVTDVVYPGPGTAACTITYTVS
jgi:hypothetical protein